MSDKRLYETRVGGLRGVRYSLDESLYFQLFTRSPSPLNHSPAWMEKCQDMILLESFENFVATSEFYSHATAHIGVLIAILTGATNWWQIVLAITIGFFIGKVFSCIPSFITNNPIGNMFMAFLYNRVQVYFILDIAFFVCYVFLLKTWWMIPVHIAVFFLIQQIFGFLFMKSRNTSLNKLAERLLESW
ncbi:MAG: hypothetical protein E7638_04790 [Ruminococcaceae bacterium]|nr:hypothetical protein [Oscillospiraceae bacterium]